MFLLYEYDIFWAFLIISSLIPILVFFISGFLAPSSKGPEKLSSYESGIEPIGDAWLQFRIRYYMFALVFVVFDVETVFSLSMGNEFRCIRFYAWRKGALEWS
ncbi:putative NADH:ubiquinone/plastoquinone oxidoreductase, chain 3 [Helianthus debilis subsp. tardiflorus]